VGTFLSIGKKRRAGAVRSYKGEKVAQYVTEGWAGAKGLTRDHALPFAPKTTAQYLAGDFLRCAQLKKEKTLR